jgi:membrane-bound ClpP family serine protease
MRRQLLTEDQLRALPPGRADPNAGATIKEKGQTLTLTGEQASNLHLAILVNDLPELYASYGFDPERVHIIDQDWLDNLATFLRRWEVTAMLVLVGIGFMVLELKMPGFGVPGIISAVCFVLFFWAHSQYSGQLALLAGLLFLLGLILLAVEIFVLPGFGVTGVSGIVLIIIGLGLATMERVPQTTAEWTNFGSVVSVFAALLIVASIGTFLVAHFLPHIPVLNRLAPPGPLDEDSDDGDGGGTGLSPERAALLGQVGVATTILRPAGMARFGEELVDVVTDGAFVLEGARVQVIELEGNRIVVKEV